MDGDRRHATGPKKIVPVFHGMVFSAVAAIAGYCVGLIGAIDFPNLWNKAIRDTSSSATAVRAAQARHPGHREPRD
jgi:hypothetical protein